MILNIEIDNENKRIEATKLGAGMFVTAYVPTDFNVPGFDNPVIIMPKYEDEYSKEILCNIESEYFPKIENLGYDKTDKAVYVMEKYAKLTKATATPKAWAEFQALNKAWKNGLYSKHNRVTSGYMANNDIIESLEDSPLKDALSLLESWANSYGPDYTFEFNKGNMGLDNQGNLILRDPVFSAKALKKIRK